MPVGNEEKELKNRGLRIFACYRLCRQRQTWQRMARVCLGEDIEYEAARFAQFISLIDTLMVSSSESGGSFANASFAG